MRAALRDWFLTSLPQPKLCEARSLEEALRHAEQTSLDLALINVELPGPSGIEAARQLRIRDGKLRLVVMSVHDSEALRIAALEAGADAFVCKRELRMTLLPVVQRLMQRI